VAVAEDKKVEQMALAVLGAEELEKPLLERQIQGAAAVLVPFPAEAVWLSFATHLPQPLQLLRLAPQPW